MNVESLTPIELFFLIKLEDIVGNSISQKKKAEIVKFHFQEVMNQIQSTTLRVEALESMKYSQRMFL
jgi:hypothetical protein